MIAGGDALRVYVATRPIDFRKGHDGLAALVQPIFGLDPFSGAAFIFRSKRADRLKILVWDKTGLVLIHKRLEGTKFFWPQVRDGVMRMSPVQFAALFEGSIGGSYGPSDSDVRSLPDKCGGLNQHRVRCGKPFENMIKIAHEPSVTVRRKRCLEGAFSADAGCSCRASGGVGPVRGSTAATGSHRQRSAARQVRREIGKAEPGAVQSTS